MRQPTDNLSHVRAVAIRDRLAVWNRRLLTGAIVLSLCGASMLAGEGMLINPVE